jgi:hypothetical protein
MDWLIIWMVLILVMVLLGWLACTYFWRYYAIFKHLVWGCLVLLVGFLSYDYGIDRGTWVVRDAYQAAREVKADGLSSGVNLSNDSSTAQEDAKIPFLYDTIVAGFLMYCVLMLLVGGQIVNNSASKAGSRAVEPEGRLDSGSRTLSR